jgi:hypothetical protein
MSEFNDLFGTKELYDAILKTTYPIEINGRNFVSGEVVAAFDEIKMAFIGDERIIRQASGGYNNTSLILWDDVKDVRIKFAQGIFTKVQFAIMTNSKLIEPVVQKDREISYCEELESDNVGNFTLKFTPLQKEFFIYDKITGNKIMEYTIVDKLVHIPTVYTDVIVRYLFLYNDRMRCVKVGTPLINGYLTFEGKMRLKDRTDGYETTGILKIPKLKLMSDLSIQLGEEANPLMSQFEAIGYPIGERGNKTVCDISFLNEDIDSEV